MKQQFSPIRSPVRICRAAEFVQYGALFHLALTMIARIVSVLRCADTVQRRHGFFIPRLLRLFERSQIRSLFVHCIIYRLPYADVRRNIVRARLRDPHSQHAAPRMSYDDYLFFTESFFQISYDVYCVFYDAFLRQFDPIGRFLIVSKPAPRLIPCRQNEFFASGA